MGEHWSEERNPFSATPVDDTHRATVAVLLDELLVECRGNRRRLTELIEEAQHAVELAHASVLLRRRRQSRRHFAVGDR